MLQLGLDESSLDFINVYICSPKGTERRLNNRHSVTGFMAESPSNSAVGLETSHSALINRDL